MNMETLYELELEVQRLTIAGSGLAIGDFRLQRFLTLFSASGEQPPVFARIAGLVEQLIYSELETSAERLLELANLLNAVLYTQGETGAPGELNPIPVTPVADSNHTYIPYRQLKPVIDALTTNGPGRLEIIQQADQEGLFQDMRLIYPALKALEDSYPDITNLAFNILLRKGKSIIPLLMSEYQPAGGKKDARRLELVAALLGAGAKDLYLNAIEHGSVVVKLAAIKALKDVPGTESLLEDLTRDRKKEIREAATEALKQMHPVAEMFKGLGKMFKG